MVMRRVGSGACVVLALFAGDARAQTAPQTAAPTRAPLILTMPTPTGDTRGVMTDGETRAWLEPLRLSLSGASLGLGRFHLGCATHEATPSTSWLKALAPKLSLFGANAGGCPLDDVATGGVA